MTGRASLSPPWRRSDSYVGKDGRAAWSSALSLSLGSRPACRATHAVGPMGAPGRPTQCRTASDEVAHCPVLRVSFRVSACPQI